MIPTKNCCFLSKEISTGKKVSSTGVEMRNIFYLCHIWYVYAFLITVIDHGNSELVGSELELFETLESSQKSRIFKKIGDNMHNCSAGHIIYVRVLGNFRYQKW